MAVLEQIESSYFSDVNQFIKDNALEQQFRDKFGVDIDEWDYPITDSEIIIEFLEERDGYYLLDYIDDGNCGYLHLRKFKFPEVKEINKKE